MCYSTKIQTFSPTKHPKWPLVHHGGIIIPLAMPRIAATSLLEQIFFFCQISTKFHADEVYVYNLFQIKRLANYAVRQLGHCVAFRSPLLITKMRIRTVTT